MHGIMRPVGLDHERHAESLPLRVWSWLWQRRIFMLIVVVPTLLLAGYLFLFASDQYESEAHILVRSAEGKPQSSSMSLLGGSSSGDSIGEAASIADYLMSHDAVEALRRDDHLIERYHRSDADIFSRLRTATPTPEQLLKYYRKQVDVSIDRDSGITVVKVHSFRPEDSYELVGNLLSLGEQRVNVLNKRTYADSIAQSQRQVAEIERSLAGVQSKMTQFRQARRDIDPQASGQAQIGVVSTLTEQLSSARSQLQTMGRMINHSSPQYQAVEAKVRALEAQVGTQSSRIAGTSGAIATDIGDYENLKLQQQFLETRYQAAAATLDKARDTAQRQQLYVVRIVNPNYPVKSLFPQRFRILATAVIALLLAYSIGWLIAAGVREHAM